MKARTASSMKNSWGEGVNKSRAFLFQLRASSGVEKNLAGHPGVLLFYSEKSKLNFSLYNNTLPQEFGDFEVRGRGGEIFCPRRDFGWTPKTRSFFRLPPLDTFRGAKLCGPIFNKFSLGSSLSFFKLKLMSGETLILFAETV